MKLKKKLFKYGTYPFFGLLAFYANSQLDLNYFVKGYLYLLELQIVIVLFVFLKSKLNKEKNIKSEF